MSVSAADPGWWVSRGVKTSSPASNLSPVTIGQAKHMAAMALAELHERLPQAKHNELAAALAQVVNLAPPQPPGGNPAPPPPGYQKPSFSVLAIGQLKAIAQPFYDVLREQSPGWLDWQMSINNIRVSEPGANQPSFSNYPWTVAVSDDSNKAVATLGQLKAAFCIDFSLIGAPQYDDSDGDGMPDAQDAFPDDPSRWDVPSASSGDTSAPLILLTAPEGATQI